MTGTNNKRLVNDYILTAQDQINYVAQISQWPVNWLNERFSLCKSVALSPIRSRQGNFAPLTSKRGLYATINQWRPPHTPK